VNVPPSQEWKHLLQDRLESPEALASALDLDPEMLAQVTARYPARINAYYLDLIRKHGKPLFLQAVPRKEELEEVPGLLPDGLCEEAQSPVPGLFHRYPDRVILAVSSECALFCRYCMRKRDLGKKNVLDERAALAYLEDQPGIRDVILSGGDPLMLSDERLETLLSAIRRIPHVETLRIHTRMPCTLPQRITPELVAMLRRFAPLFVNTHFNHPAEITELSRRACGLLVDAGIPVGCQSVLLRGVNDDSKVLATLFRRLLAMRVKPYYLHHPDPVAGILPFRLDLAEGLALYRKVRGHISGMAVPPYMIDLPGGGGKVPLHPDFPYLIREDGWMRVLNFEGNPHFYPALARPLGPAPFLDKKEKAMEISLTKMHGLGNDFLLLDDRDGRIAEKKEYGELARQLCDRHFGVGADGLILALPSLCCDVAFRIFNADGSEAGMCGNGIRCFVKYLYETSRLRQKIMNIETRSGPVVCILENDAEDQVQTVRVDMGEPRLLPHEIPFRFQGERAIEVPLQVLDQTFQVTPVSMGNPHAVIFMESIEHIPIESWGPALETHEAFPEKTNVEFAEILSPQRVRVRVWERGAGLTLACGTGACAVVVAGVLTGRLERRAEVLLPGGRLFVDWDERSNHIYKRGPAVRVFETQIRIE